MKTKTMTCSFCGEKGPHNITEYKKSNGKIGEMFEHINCKHVFPI